VEAWSDAIVKAHIEEGIDVGKCAPRQHPLKLGCTYWQASDFLYLRRKLYAVEKQRHVVDVFSVELVVAKRSS